MYAPRQSHIPPASPHFDLVVLAGSAGGLAAVSAVLRALPSDWSVPIAVLLHRSVQQPNLLPHVLAGRTSLRVKLVETGDVMRAGTVYVARPDLHLVLQPDRTFACHDGARIEHLLSSADPLLYSAAQVLGPRLLAVVLTGGGHDGARGVLEVHDRGGTVIAQDRATSQAFGMPSSAIATGGVTYTLPLERIPTALSELVRTGRLATPAE